MFILELMFDNPYEKGTGIQLSYFILNPCKALMKDSFSKARITNSNLKRYPSFYPHINYGLI